MKISQIMLAPNRIDVNNGRACHSVRDGNDRVLYLNSGRINSLTNSLHGLLKAQWTVGLLTTQLCKPPQFYGCQLLNVSAT